VFESGRSEDGKARIWTTVCPSRIIAAFPEANDIIAWWVDSSPWSYDPNSGMGTPSGPPEWPFPGGLLNQPAPLVEAVSILRSELPYAQLAGIESRRKKPKES
jgi:hypothetical protein